MQWAVGTRALRVDVRASRPEFVLEHDGEATSPEDLKQLLPRALGREDTPLRDLAIGVNAALKLGPVQVQSGAWLLELEVGREELKQVPAIDRTRVRVRRPPGRWLDFWLGTAEQRALTRLCRFAPVPLLVNGSLVQRELSPDALGGAQGNMISYYEKDWRWWKPDGLMPNTSSYAVPGSHHVVELRIPGPGIGLLPSRASFLLRSPNGDLELPPPPPVYGILQRRIRPPVPTLEKVSVFLGTPALPLLTQTEVRKALERFPVRQPPPTGITLVHRGVTVGMLPSSSFVGAWALHHTGFDLSSLQLQDDDRRRAETLVNEMCERLISHLLQTYSVATLKHALQAAWLDAHARRQGRGARTP